MARCASCDLTLAAGQLRAQAAILDALERPDEALAARTEAERLDGLSCCWWWRRKVESTEPDPVTGQPEEKILEECGKLALPAFLNDFGWSTRMAAQSVQTATSETARTAGGIEALAGAVREVLRRSEELSRRSLGTRIKGLLR